MKKLTLIPHAILIYIYCSEAVADLIPTEDKLKVISCNIHASVPQRIVPEGVAELIPLKKVESDTPLSILEEYCSEGVAQLIPDGDNLKAIPISIYCLEGGGGFDPLIKIVEVNPIKQIIQRCSEEVAEWIP